MIRLMNGSDWRNLWQYRQVFEVDGVGIRVKPYFAPGSAFSISCLNA
jgi:hypothetical protein